MLFGRWCKIAKTIQSGFPGLAEKIMGLNDPRKRKDYSLTELVVCGMMLVRFQRRQPQRFRQ